MLVFTKGMLREIMLDLAEQDTTVGKCSECTKDNLVLFPYSVNDWVFILCFNCIVEEMFDEIQK